LEDKCFIALETVGTEGEAEAKCSQLDPTSTLVTIHTTQEEEWLTNYLKTFAHISEVVWIGLKWSGKGFVWVDNIALDYKSWGKDAILDGSLLCADLSLKMLTMGNWTDNSCNKKALIACQSPQMCLSKLSKELFKLKTQFSEQQAKITTLEAQVVPVGFIYTQLPNMSAPTDMWPKLKWTDVSAQYAGLFFRTDGGTAAKFGETQPANQSWISTFNIVAMVGTKRDHDTSLYPEQLNQGWSTNVLPGDNDGFNGLSLFTTSGETRPRNTAIRLWKRIE
jgi:hypothetical protein